MSSLAQKTYKKTYHIVYKCVLAVMWSCINGHLVAKAMMTEVKVVSGNKLFELEVFTCKNLKI